MPIPQFNTNGLLPHGIYDCSLDEIKERFASIPDKAKRTELYNKLVKYVDQLKRAEIPCSAIIVDGSFVTEKPEPSDVDLAVVLDYDDSNLSSPQIGHSQDCIDVMNYDNIKRIYGFTVFTVFEDSFGYDEIVDFFFDLEPPYQEITKGILRVKL